MDLFIQFNIYILELKPRTKYYGFYMVYII